MRIEDKNKLNIEASDMQNRATKLVVPIIEEINNTPIEERDAILFAVIDALNHLTKLPVAHKHGIIFQAIVFDLASSAIKTYRNLGL